MSILKLLQISRNEDLNKKDAKTTGNESYTIILTSFCSIRASTSFHYVFEPIKKWNVQVNVKASGPCVKFSDSQPKKYQKRATGWLVTLTVNQGNLWLDWTSTDKLFQNFRNISEKHELAGVRRKCSPLNISKFSYSIFW